MDIKLLRRTLAKRFHPDLGGSVENMTHLLSVWDDESQLLNLAKGLKCQTDHIDEIDDRSLLAEPAPDTIVTYGFTSKTQYVRFKKYANKIGIPFDGGGLVNGYYRVVTEYRFHHHVVKNSGTMINPEDNGNVTKVYSWMKSKCRNCQTLVIGQTDYVRLQIRAIRCRLLKEPISNSLNDFKWYTSDEDERNRITCEVTDWILNKF